MGRLLLRLLINGVALYVAVQLVPGIEAAGGWGTLAVVAIIFGIVNALIRPLVKVLSCPLIILTLGLFTLVINAFMLWLASVVAQALGAGFYVRDFWSAFLGGLIVAVVSFVLSMFLIEPERDRRDSRR